MVTGVAVARSTGEAASTTDPHAWHSPQRPTHLEVSQPHSVQRWAGGALAVWGSRMAVTLGDPADIARQPRGSLWTTAVGAAPYPSLMLTTPTWNDQAGAAARRWP